MNSHCAIAAWLECFQEKPSWCRNEQVCQGRISVKRLERSNGLETALYKNIPFFLSFQVFFVSTHTLATLNVLILSVANFSALRNFIQCF